MSMQFKDKDVNMNFRVPHEYRDAMKKRSEELGLNVSQFFRNCMEKELGIKPLLKTPTSHLEGTKRDTRLVNFRCPTDLYEDFIQACKSHNMQHAKVLRGFMETFTHLLSREGTPVDLEESVLYLAIFLQNEMSKYGYTLVPKDRITKRHMEEDSPLIDLRHDKDNNPIWLVYDKTNQDLYTFPFIKAGDNHA